MPVNDEEFDPARAYAVCVGVGEHEGWPEMPALDGAVDDAVRFANWALAQDIPNENIRLGITSEPPGLDIPDVPRFTPTGDELATVLTTGFQDARFLTVTWSGHGVLDRARRRALFLANATARNRAAINVETITTYLGARANPCPHQLFVIDACANFLSDLKWDELPAQALPVGDTAGALQLGLFAAAQGRTTPNNRAERRGEFSHAVLQVLQQCALPPDPMTLFTETERAVEGMETPPAFRRVRPSIQGRPEWDDDHGPVPVPAFQFERLAGLNISPRQARGFAQRVSCHTSFDDPQVVQDVIDAVPDFPMPAGLRPGPGDLADAIVTAISAGRAEAAYTDADGLWPVLSNHLSEPDLRLAHQLWKLNDEVAPVLARLGRPSRRDVTAAFRRQIRSDDHVEWDFYSALVEAGLLPRDADEGWALHRLVADLEDCTSQVMPDEWYGVGIAHAIRDAVAARRDERPRLFLGLQTDISDWASPITATISKGTFPSAWDCTADRASVEHAVGEALEQAWDGGAPRPWVGFMLGRSNFEADPSAWNFSQDPFADPVPANSSFSTTMHCADRFLVGRAAKRWRSMGDRFQTAAAVQTPITWAPSTAASSVELREWVRGVDPPVVLGLPFVPPAADPERSKDLLLAAIMSAPCVIWFSQEPGDWAAARTQVDAFVVQGPLKSAPERLAAAVRDSPASALSHIRMVWDDPGVADLMAMKLGGVH